VEAGAFSRAQASTIAMIAAANWDSSASAKTCSRNAIDESSFRFAVNESRSAFSLLSN